MIKTKKSLIFRFLFGIFILSLSVISGAEIVAINAVELDTTWCNNVDINQDGEVDISELAIFSAVGYDTDCSLKNCMGADFNKDGKIDVGDLAMFSANYGRTDCNGTPGKFPRFLNYSDNTKTFKDSGIAIFNVKVLDTNGSVWLNINDTNYTATNTSFASYFVNINLTTGYYNYTWYAIGIDSVSLNNSETFNYEINSSVYPFFSNYSDNTKVLNDSGIAIFNVNILNTNGSVWLNINDTNYTANKTDTNQYTVLINLAKGNYTYFWSAYGNDSVLNTSEIRQYSFNFVPVEENKVDSTSSNSGGSSGGWSCKYDESYDWGCSEWTICIDGVQTRTCKSFNNCGNSYGKPDTQQTCEIELETIQGNLINQTEVPVTPSPGITGQVIGGLTSTTGLVVIFFLMALTGSYFIVRYLRKRKLKN